MNVTAARPAASLATDKQQAFISKLLRANQAMANKLAADPDNAAEANNAVDEFLADLQFLTKKQASEMIGSLLDREKDLKSQVAELPDADPADVVTDGMYKVGGRIFKVQIAKNGSGRLYAKELLTEAIGDDQFASRFEYIPGALRLISPADRMTLEQAKEFGALYGNCCACGRDLTNEESIELGIGPICRGKF